MVLLNLKMTVIIPLAYSCDGSPLSSGWTPSSLVWLIMPFLWPLSVHFFTPNCYSSNAEQVIFHCLEFLYMLIPGWNTLFPTTFFHMAHSSFQIQFRGVPFLRKPLPSFLPILLHPTPKMNDPPQSSHRPCAYWLLFTYLLIYVSCSRTVSLSKTKTYF